MAILIRDRDESPHPREWWVSLLARRRVHFRELCPAGSGAVTCPSPAAH